MTLTIIADDLTGACDTGCLFAGPAPVGVIAEPGLVRSDAGVVAVDTESRALAAPEAGRRVRAAASRLGSRLHAGPLFKKIDSTMRGPVAAELAALLDTGGWDGALVCPAFPAQGRVVRDGVLYVDGVPAHETAIGRDRHYPGGTSNVAMILAQGLAHGATRVIHRLPLAAVRAGAEAVRDVLGRAAGGLVAADAETDGDLAVLAGATTAPRPAWLLAGSAGLGQAMAGALRFPRATVPLPSGRAWLWVVGSLHAASRAQLVELQAAGAVGVSLEGRTDAGRRAPDLSPVLRALGGGQPAYLASDPRARLAPREASRALGVATARVLADAAPDVLAVTGGETAYEVLQALSATRLDLLGAPASGLALGALTVAGSARLDGSPLPLLAKAGGFGAPDLFLTLLERRAA
jgi:uncharacterized protein YgbK (DUF1537 family)